MSIPVQLTCPNCDARLKLKAPPAPNSKFRCRACRVVFLADGTEVDESAGSRSRDDSPQTATASRVQRTAHSRQAAKLDWKWIAGPIAAVVLLIILFLVPWAKVGEVLSQINPFADTRQRIFASGLTELDRAETLLKKYDQKPDQPPVEELGEVCNRIAELYNRAIKIPKLTPDELEEFTKSHSESLGRHWNFGPNDPLSREVPPGHPLFSVLIQLKINRSFLLIELQQLRKPGEEEAVVAETDEPKREGPLASNADPQDVLEPEQHKFDGESVTPPGVPLGPPGDRHTDFDQPGTPARKLPQDPRTGREVAPWEAQRQLVQEHGSQNILTVTYRMDLPMAEKQRIADGMTKIIGKPPADKNIDVMLIYVTDESPKFMARQIDFAKVTSVVDITRQISLEPLAPGENPNSADISYTHSDRMERERIVQRRTGRVRRGTIELAPSGAHAQQPPPNDPADGLNENVMEFGEAIRAFGKDSFLIVDLPSGVEIAERQKVIAELKALLLNAKMANIDRDMVIFKTAVNPKTLVDKVKTANVLGADPEGHRLTLTRK